MFAAKKKRKKKIQKKEQKLLEKQRNLEIGEKQRDTHSCFYSALEKRAFQNDGTLCFFARSFFLSFFFYCTFFLSFFLLLLRAFRRAL